MTLFSVTYCSYYGEELFCDTQIYTDYEKVKEVYKDNVLDIVENICDEEEKQEFLETYNGDDLFTDVYWENWTGEQMYRLVVKSH